MTPKLNETARNLADAFRRYIAETASRYRTPGRHAGPEGDRQHLFDSAGLQQALRRARTYSTPARKTAALGTGASLLLSGMVFGVAEAATLEAPETVSERQLVNIRQLDEEPPAEAPVEDGAGSTAPVQDGAGTTAPVAEEPPAKPSVPVDGMVITSPFGWRINPMTGSGQEWHTGTDFRGVTGTEVRSARAGTVTEAGWHTTGGGGLRVVVDHGNGTQTTYNHLNDIRVEPGQPVGEGQAVGGVGSTGNSTGPHLHFEVLINGEYIDPMTWL
ncbi:M23 family metallopeptidase [Arthrobacter koreensis]|uniref:M23 family metallopeptidase n=1 Tax=Arthrobacter koreensis TaxID=199136 RepID=UPI0024091315|nr:M23 family metallopeptidase [Arthrobacter koreensis]MDF2497322.1 family metallopeptidase [Arthrobacter koreensis]